MSVSFNVLDDPWIPVVCKDGSRELLGIRETLRRAPELNEISAVSPLEEFSVYRFLSVFLMDALRPKRKRAIQNLLKQGAFDMEQIEAYISLCKVEGESFYLFDEKRPFLQAAYVKERDKKPESASRLDFTQPNGNNHTHFEHGGAGDYRLPFAEALPKLLAANIFAINGGRGYQPSVSSEKGKNPYMVLINGNNLFQTLCFMLLPANEHDYDGSEHGAWMRVREIKEGQIPDTSFFRMMLYPVRSILLEPDEDQTTIRSVYYCGGYKLPEKGIWRDPNVAYQKITVTQDDGGCEKWSSVLPDLDVAPWRNYSEIIREEGLPEVISRFCAYDIGWKNVTVTLYGLYSDNGNCVNTIRCSLRLHKSLLESEFRKEVVDFCIKDADSIGAALERSLCVALQHKKKNAKGKDIKRANAKVMEVANIFFSRCESLFWKLIDDMDCHEDEDLEKLRENWRRDVFETARQEYETAVSSIRANGKMFHQVVWGEEILYEWNKPFKRRKQK